MLSILRTPPMLRTVLTALLLAALTAVSGRAVQTTHSTRTHKTTTSTHTSHRSAHRSSVNAAHHTTRLHSRYASHRTATSTHRRATLRRVKAERVRTTHRYSRSVPADAGDTSRAPESPLATDSAPESTVAASAAEISPAPETSRPATSQIAALHIPRIVSIAPLRGSRDSLVRQNEKSEADDLERIENDDDLNDRIARGMLVPVPVSAALAINGNLPQNRRYCRPWTAHFLTDLARAHQAQFHHPLEVSSAVRTVEYQKRLMGVNGNAAAAEGDVVSPHVTGATIDIAKSGLGQREIYWMRSHLLPLQNAGKIDVEEEFQQACFHITVYKTYVTPGPVHKPRRRTDDAPQSPAPDTTQTPSSDTPPTPVGVASSGL